MTITGENQVVQPKALINPLYDHGPVPLPEIPIVGGLQRWVFRFYSSQIPKAQAVRTPCRARPSLLGTHGLAVAPASSDYDNQQSSQRARTCTRWCSRTDREIWTSGRTCSSIWRDVFCSAVPHRIKLAILRKSRHRTSWLVWVAESLERPIPAPTYQQSERPRHQVAYFP